MEEAFGHTPRTRRLLINITPLVDVMLLLLIFFMATSTFRDMRALDLQLPEAATGEKHADHPLEIALTEGGEISFDGVTMDHDGLRAALTATLVENPDAQFVLRADKRVAYAHVVTILDLARGQGIDQLILPVTTPKKAE